MLDIELTKLSSKGQVVIPHSLRKGFVAGEKFAIIRKDSRLILEPVSKMGKTFEEDIEFAEKTMDAIKRYEKGGFRSMSGEEFLEELEKW